MFLSKKLLAAVPEFPIGMTPPSSYTTQTIVDLSNTESYQSGVFSESGWYRVSIGGADGRSTSTTATNGQGGYASQIFFAYSGTKYIIWGANQNKCGYPNTAAYNLLGGTGGRGRGHTSSGITKRGGAGGGSPTEGGSTLAPMAGAGAGFVCGMDETVSGVATETESFSDPGYFSVDTVFTMVLAGGGGAAGMDATSGSVSTAGGGGGGAWGNGGTGGAIPSLGNGSAGGTGPGGTSGAGVNGQDSVYNGRAGSGGDGGWAIRDYTTNTFSYGTGTNSRPAAQVCILEKLIY